MVDVPVKQATPATLRHPPIDITMIMNLDQATNLPSQPPPSQPPPTQPNRSKTKIFVKKSYHLDCQAYDTSLENRVYRLERKVVEISKFDIQAAIDKSVEARLKQIELPKGIPDFKKIKLEKAAKQNVPKTSWNKIATVIYDQKSRLYRMMEEVKAFNSHLSHQALFDALAVSLSINEDDMDRIFGKGNLIPIRMIKTKMDLQSTSKLSKSNKPVDADEVIHDVEIDTGECVEDAVCDSSPNAHAVNKTKWFKQSLRPATPESPNPDWSKDQNADTGLSQNWFPKIEKTTKAPKDFNDVLGSTFDFLNVIKYRLNKYTLTKADLKGPVFELFKGSYRSCIELEYHLSNILSIVRITVEKYCGYGYLKEIVVKKVNQKEYVFKKADLPSLHLNDIEDMLTNYGFGYDKCMPTRPWSDKDKKRAMSMVKVIEKTLQGRQMIRILKCYIGGRNHEADYRLLSQTD
ncbi:hypothetical protein Tco_1377686 [Tanacetum coccineum]